MKLLAALALLFTVGLFFAPQTALGQDVFAKIRGQEEKVDKLHKEILVSQRRMLSSATAYENQEVAYQLLDHVSNLTGSASRELGVLTQMLMLAELVADKRAKPLAQKIVEFQTAYMKKTIQNSTDYIERSLHRAKDPETSRLLLEARDQLRASYSLADWIALTEKKQ